MTPESVEVKLHDLERVLVKQFRMLQHLVDITKGERAGLLNDGVDLILSNVEKKEAVLDQLSLIEDHRRMLVQDIAVSLNVRSESISVEGLLPYFSPEIAAPIHRLAEGISTLVIQVRDLTYGNQALASSKLDWLRSFQSFLVSLSLPNAGYRPPGNSKRPDEPAVSGFEYRA